MNRLEIKCPNEMLASNNIISISPPGAKISFETAKIFAHLELRINELKDEKKWLKQQIELKDDLIMYFLKKDEKH